jgi:myo-inositol catabolism protein IolS
MGRKRPLGRGRNEQFMNYKKLGPTGFSISEVALGCWVTGGDYWGEVDEQDSIAAIRGAIDHGVNFVDTAELYGSGLSETVIGKALAGISRDSIYLATKVWTTHMRKSDVKQACEDSLGRLQTDYTDVYFVHYPSKEVPLDETMEAMISLKKEGKIRSIGVSNFSLAQLEHARRLGPIDVIQPCYNLFWRFIDADVLPYCVNNNIGVVVYSPIAQGILTGKFNKGVSLRPGDARTTVPLFKPQHFPACTAAVEQMKPIAKKYKKTLAQVAINWTNSRPGVTASIVGARTPDQAAENAGASGWTMDAQDLDAIDRLGKTVTSNMPAYESFFSDRIKSS